LEKLVTVGRILGVPAARRNDAVMIQCSAADVYTLLSAV